ncbi:MAG: hypothetical protein F6J93_26780 [Oscillatoria sp. SIO1A7]|nr:hypothetical protein [Oscillatoria sp. SIO1A7]
MSKLVVFKIGEGGFEAGFPVSLTVGEEGSILCVEVNGRSPPGSIMALRASQKSQGSKSQGQKSKVVFD